MRTIAIIIIWSISTTISLSCKKGRGKTKTTTTQIKATIHNNIPSKDTIYRAFIKQYRQIIPHKYFRRGALDGYIYEIQLKNIIINTQSLTLTVPIKEDLKPTPIYLTFKIKLINNNIAFELKK